MAGRRFEEARRSLDERGLRPLRAIADHDEAVLWLRRGAPGDRERARPLLESALARFRQIGIPGWVRSAEEKLAAL